MSETPLLDKIGLDAAERERRLAFLGITKRDYERLAELTPVVESLAEGVIERFYEYILDFREATEFLGDADLVHLKRAQRTHLVSLVSGPFDGAYFESRVRVGLAHARINLAPQWYLGGYGVQIQYLMRGLFARHGDEPVRLVEWLESLLKVVLLDIELTMEAYISGAFTERSVAEEHASTARRAIADLETHERDQMRREDFFRMVAHDIRSPVTAMMLTARLGLRRFPDQDDAPGKQFGLIEEAGRSTITIIDNMLTVARMTGGELPVELERFDVVGLLHTCAEELEPFSRHSGHGLTVDVPSRVEVAALDRMLVRRIVTNLLVNAIRHTPAGTQVLLECRRDGSMCVISIEDDGPGLPKNVGDCVFGEEGELGRVSSGLGLPFCRLACERLGGSIEIERLSGKGSRFIVTLPAD